MDQRPGTAAWLPPAPPLHRHRAAPPAPSGFRRRALFPVTGWDSAPSSHRPTPDRHPWAPPPRLDRGAWGQGPPGPRREPLRSVHPAAAAAPRCARRSPRTRPDQGYRSSPPAPRRDHRDHRGGGGRRGLSLQPPPRGWPPRPGRQRRSAPRQRHWPGAGGCPCRAVLPHGLNRHSWDKPAQIIRKCSDPGACGSVPPGRVQ